MDFMTTIERVTRRLNSKSGNPSFILHTPDGAFLTETDAAVNAAIGIHWQNVPVILRTAGGRVVGFRRTDTGEVGGI